MRGVASDGLRRSAPPGPGGARRCPVAPGGARRRSEPAGPRDRVHVVAQSLVLHAPEVQGRLLSPTVEVVIHVELADLVPVLAEPAEPPTTVGAQSSRLG